MFIDVTAHPCEHCGKTSNLTRTNIQVNGIYNALNEDRKLEVDGWDTYKEKLNELYKKFTASFIRKVTKEEYLNTFSIARSYNSDLTVTTSNSTFERLSTPIFIATSDLYFIPQYGAESFTLIIPTGIRVYDVNGVGHCGIYDVDTNINRDFTFYLFDWMLVKKDPKKLGPIKPKRRCWH